METSPLTIILSTLGIGAILLFLVKHFVVRYTQNKDKHHAIDITNQGKAIDAETEAFQLVLARLKVVEERLDKVQAEHTSHMKEYGKVTAENAWLKKDNERQENEIKELRDDAVKRTARIEELERKVDELTRRIEAMQKG